MGEVRGWGRECRDAVRSSPSPEATQGVGRRLELNIYLMENKWEF